MKRTIYSVFAWVLGAICVQAQDLLTNDNSLVVIGLNVPFSVGGGISNSGSILNEGAMRLHGDWTNSGDYRSVSGTFSLVGSNQIFTPGESSYAHLEINSTGVAVLGDLTITDRFNLVEGIVSFATDAQLNMLEGATIEGGDASAYIDGTLYTEAQGNLLLPIGTETEYLPVELVDVQSDSAIGIRAYSEALEASTAKQLKGSSPNRYWRIIENNSFKATQIYLPVIEENFMESEEDAVIAFASDLDQALRIKGLPAFDGTLTSGVISTTADLASGYYLIAEKNAGGPPVKVINVVTSLQDGKHDFMRIENIEFYEDNLVEIFDRQGVKVFEMSGYNNQDRVFRGFANVGSRGTLETGSYYYTVQLTSSKREAGFIYVKN